jgi:hypothetical protein
MAKKARKTNAKSGGPNGGAGDGVYLKGGAKKANKTNAIGTQQWVADKIAEGDIAGGMAANQSGTSIFDPVLTELSYRWFCPPGGQILDPFAGGSVRGIVASFLGRRYLGVELREEQIAANRHQAGQICRAGALVPEWIEGDSRHQDTLLPEGFEADFVFSCPPYADLEVYSEDPRDLSTMDYGDFLAAYIEIIAKACARLRNDRFACFVVGDVRDKSGFYRGFPWHTISAFEAAGLRLYNEAVLYTAAGSLPMRVNRQFSAGRKFGKTHQNVLVFCKGDWRKATEAVGPNSGILTRPGARTILPIARYTARGASAQMLTPRIRGEARRPSHPPPAPSLARAALAASNPPIPARPWLHARGPAIRLVPTRPASSARFYDRRAGQRHHP